MADSLTHCVRFASANLPYPLSIDGPAEWGRGRVPVRVPLPDVPADHIVTASFSSISAAPFSFRLETGRERYESARFGARARRRERGNGGSVVVPVDYFEVRRDLRAPTLSLVCGAPRPADYLLVVAVRPREIAPPQRTPADIAPKAAPRLSQMTLPDPVRLQACSPTATAMALGIEGRTGFESFVASAHHPPTGLYGAWPQNIWAAARHGVHGGVELASDWSLAGDVLSRGGALVASIRFGCGELAGSPRQQTAGHLVQVRGFENGAVIVNDPAAQPEDVERRYDAAEFAAVWMRRRGVAYVFAPSRS